jgi:hypothetical protein
MSTASTCTPTSHTSSFPCTIALHLSLYIILLLPPFTRQCALRFVSTSQVNFLFEIIYLYKTNPADKLRPESMPRRLQILNRWILIERLKPLHESLSMHYSRTVQVSIELFTHQPEENYYAYMRNVPRRLKQVLFLFKKFSNKLEPL